MNTTSIARLASLIGEPARIQMLTSLLDGESHSASELALVAAVSAQAASSHLAKLNAGGLVTCERRGKHRLYSLRNVQTAVAIEALGALAQKDSKETVMPELRFARTCYDHLAGALAISLRDELLKRELLRHRGADFALTAQGERLL